MPTNIEIKARITSVDALRPRAAALADRGPIEITQDDTYFACEGGRLKLRSFSRHDGELIFYRRADGAGPKESFYVRSHTPEPDTLRDALSLAYGQIGRVRKHRLLFMLGRTRIHLDRVDDLGDFVELEVVLADGEAANAALGEAQRLMAHLGIRADDLVEGSYVDLIQTTPVVPSALASK